MKITDQIADSDFESGEGSPNERCLAMLRRHIEANEPVHRELAEDAQAGLDLYESKELDEQSSAFFRGLGMQPLTMSRVPSIIEAVAGRSATQPFRPRIEATGTEVVVEVDAVNRVMRVQREHLSLQTLESTAMRWGLVTGLSGLALHVERKDGVDDDLVAELVSWNELMPDFGCPPELAHQRSVVRGRSVRYEEVMRLYPGFREKFEDLRDAAQSGGISKSLWSGCLEEGAFYGSGKDTVFLMEFHYPAITTGHAVSMPKEVYGEFEQVAGEDLPFDDNLPAREVQVLAALLQRAAMSTDAPADGYETKPLSDNLYLKLSQLAPNAMFVPTERETWHSAHVAGGTVLSNYKSPYEMPAVATYTPYSIQRVRGDRTEYVPRSAVSRLEELQRAYSFMVTAAFYYFANGWKTPIGIVTDDQGAVDKINLAAARGDRALAIPEELSGKIQNFPQSTLPQGIFQLIGMVEDVESGLGLTKAGLGQLDEVSRTAYRLVASQVTSQGATLSQPYDNLRVFRSRLTAVMLRMLAHHYSESRLRKMGGVPDGEMVGKSPWLRASRWPVVISEEPVTRDSAAVSLEMLQQGGLFQWFLSKGPDAELAVAKILASVFGSDFYTAIEKAVDRQGNPQVILAEFLQALGVDVEQNPEALQQVGQMIQQVLAGQQQPAQQQQP